MAKLEEVRGLDFSGPGMQCSSPRFDPALALLPLLIQSVPAGCAATWDGTQPWADKSVKYTEKSETSSQHGIEVCILLCHLSMLGCCIL